MKHPRFRSHSRLAVRLGVLGALLLFVVSAAFAFPQYTHGILPASSFRLGLDLKGGTHLVYEADMQSIPESDRTAALTGVKDVIERRVNAFGVAEPVVQTTTEGGHYRVIIELAGVLDVAQAVQLIGETPILEFKELNPNPPTTPNESEQSVIDAANAETKKHVAEALGKAQAGSSFNDLASAYNAKVEDKTVAATDASYAEAIKSGSSSSAGALLGSSFEFPDAYALLSFTSKDDTANTVTFHQLSFRKVGFQDLKSYADAIWLNTDLSGKDLKSAQVAFDPKTNEPLVSIAFNGDGAKKFGEITGRNIQQRVAIFLDGQIISAPTVREKIDSGEAQISGSFTLDDAKQLAQRLNAGALPVPLNILSQQTVGPTLGQTSLTQSLMAGLIGLILVALFMILFYRLPGVLAVAALLVYLSINLMLWKLLDVTITLAGIAGFILSLGIALDANVLIFARMKEELLSGRDLATAVEEGVRRAWTSIRDGNMTTLIATAILFSFSTSFIKGFALTLAIGVLTSMFSAIVITRTFLRFVIGWRFIKAGWLFGVKK